MTTRRNFIRNSALGVAAVAASAVVYATTETAASIKESGKMKVGIAREIITPKIGGYLAGYGSDKVSTSVHDDVTVTALAIECGATKAMFMNIAVCVIGTDFATKMRKMCGEAAGIPAANVIFASMHTHSGPVFTDEYLDQIFIPRCVAAAKEAVKEMKSVTVGIATTESKIGINRRKLLANDQVVLGQNPWGPYDPQMTVISFKGDDGKSVANIVHFGAHPTAAGTNTEISRDWPGVMIDRLEKESGGMTMFLLGLHGDVAPRIANGGSDGGRPGNIQYAMEVGGLAALDAVRAYKDIRGLRNEDLSVVTGVVAIPYAPLIPLDEARKELAKLQAGPQERFTGINIDVLKKNIEAHEKGQTEGSFTYDQTLIKLGPVVFVPVPFEASTEISMRLRTYSKYGYTLGLGCANGYNSYLPTRDQIPRGGYEIDRFQWSGARQLVDNADTHLIAENIKLMEKFES